MAKVRDIKKSNDPEKTVLVKSREGAHWRRRRGSVTKAVLNRVFAANAANAGICGQAAKRILQSLSQYTKELTMGRKIARFGGVLRKTMTEKGMPDLSGFKGFELQKLYPLDRILHRQYRVRIEKSMLYITIPVNKYTIIPLNDIVTSYYFEAVLLHGDVNKDNDLRTESDNSTLYYFNKKYNENCELMLHLPENRPWMVMLKAGCNEGREKAWHGRHYGMRVIDVGGFL